MIEKQRDDYTGEVLYCKCTICGIITNFDVDECPQEDKHI